MSTKELTGYPVELSLDTTTWTGIRVHLRPIQSDDAADLVDFHHHLSRDSIYRRFFFMHMELSAAEVERFTCVDFTDRMAFVAEVDGRLVGIGRYERSPRTSEAEIAFVVAEQFHHQGIATLLLEQLVDSALKCGIRTFFALTLVDNHDMLDVFRDMGFPVDTEFDNGTIRVRIQIAPCATSTAARSSRHARSAQASRKTEDAT
jgi:RimJ/RimL family protein N-acetyltransferase